MSQFDRVDTILRQLRDGEGIAIYREKKGFSLEFSEFTDGNPFADQTIKVSAASTAEGWDMLIAAWSVRHARRAEALVAHENAGTL